MSSVESPTGFHIVEIAPVSPDIPSTPPPRKMHKRGSDPHSTLSDEKSRYEQLEEPIPGQISIVVPTRAPNDSKVHQLNAGVSDVQEVPMTQDRPGALNREPPRRSGSSSTGVGAGGFVMEVPDFIIYLSLDPS